MNKIKKIFQYAFEGKLLKKWKKHYNYKKAINCRNKQSEEAYLINLGKIMLGYEMNLKNPQTFNEWINWYKLNYHNEVLPYLVDKIEVEKFIKQKGLEEILVKKYCVWKNPNEMDFESLPSQFVLKTNHDSGGVTIVKDKNHIKRSQLKKIIKSFNRDFNNIYCEWPYGKVEKKIFAEEYLENRSDNGHSLNDYKFFVLMEKLNFFLSLQKGM